MNGKTRLNMKDIANRKSGIQLNGWEKYWGVHDPGSNSIIVFTMSVQTNKLKKQSGKKAGDVAGDEVMEMLFLYKELR